MCLSHLDGFCHNWGTVHLENEKISVVFDSPEIFSFIVIVTSA